MIVWTNSFIFIYSKLTRSYNGKEKRQYGVQLEAAYQQVQDTEATLAKTLEEKYGKGNLNVDTGEFTPIT